MIREHYHQLLDALDDGYCLVEVIFDASGESAVDLKYLEVNRSFARQTGVSDAIGRTARELFGMSDGQWFEEYANVVKTGEPARLNRRDAVNGRTYEVQAIRIGARDERRVAILFRDVTERRNAEDALVASEKRARDAAAVAEAERGLLDAILDAAPAAIVVAEAGGRVLRYNTANELLWGPAPLSESVDQYGEWKGWWADGSERHGRRVAPEEWAMARALRGETVRGDIVEIEPFGQPGVRRTMVNSGAPVRDAEGRITGAIVAQMDISRLTAAESALRELNARLQEADRRKDEFISILAHELRNPLAPVRSAVEILRRAGPAEPRLVRVRDIIDRQVTHMARLIDDLLDVSRIARGKLALQTQRCDLAHVARQTAEDFRANLEAAGLRLVVTSPEAPVWVDGDPVRLAQMVGNVLQNAGRFTETGGHIEVRVWRDLARGVALVSVADTGIGIEPELLTRLFDPFSQADQDLARSKGGLGLGLALTRGLAELHGGEVTGWSEGRGHGATFTISIPLTEPAREAGTSSPSADEVPGQLRILVIEDNRDAADTLAELLEISGHEVEVAYDGESGVEAARERTPDVVISDLGLPGELDGYGVARSLRAEPPFARTTLVALSGYANEEARRASREAGFDAHLAKPVDVGKLERTLADASGKGRARNIAPR